MSKVYIETTEERQTPTTDSSSAGQMIVMPTVLAAMLAAIGAGGLAGGWVLLGFGDGIVGNGGMFVLVSMFAGGGVCGLVALVGTLIAFDRRPHVQISTNTPLVYDDDETAPQQSGVIGGNVGVTVQPKGSVTVEHDGRKFEFSSEHIRKMLDCVGNGDNTVARDKFGLGSNENYQNAVHVMDGARYWRVETTRGKIKSVGWTEAGLNWLKSNTR